MTCATTRAAAQSWPSRRMLPGGYEPRSTAGTVLHHVVRMHLACFLAETAAATDGVGLPRFIEREFRDFLGCGALSRGFARVRCDACRFERLVPFSCKARAVCPSCGGRRMAEQAAHLVDHGILAPRAKWRAAAVAYGRADPAATPDDCGRSPVRRRRWRPCRARQSWAGLADLPQPSCRSCPRRNRAQAPRCPRRRHRALRRRGAGAGPSCSGGSSRWTCLPARTVAVACA